MPVKIDYLGHSGFLVETEHALMLFDYYIGDVVSALKQKPAHKPLFVFASHFHKDHFNPDIFGIDGYSLNAKYILSSDIRKKAKEYAAFNLLFVNPDAEYEIEGLGNVRTLLSTDQGVAFLVTTEDGTFFHSGDLHWWDWSGEDPGWLAGQEKVFKREIDMIAGTRINIAFAVLDDRLEENYDKGMKYVIKTLHPAYVLPMHFWNDRTVVSRFKADNDCIDSVILNTADDNHFEILL